MREIDLHIHTTASDGTCSPAEAVRLAKDTGLRALAVTDHDTVEAHAEARAGAARVGTRLTSTKWIGRARRPTGLLWGESNPFSTVCSRYLALDCAFAAKAQLADAPEESSAR